MSDALDPLGYLLQSARRVGDEFCWPATQLLNVTRSFVALNLIILGVELRRFDEGTAEPTVIGWTEYEIPDADWSERVALASRLAIEELIEYSGDLNAWVNFTCLAHDSDCDQRGGCGFDLCSVPEG